MRLSLLLAFSFLTVICSAKGRSRIVFYSPAPVAAGVTDNTPALQILKNGTGIGAVRPGSAFVYDAESVGGDYALDLVPQAGGRPNTLHIPELPNGIAIVRADPGEGPQQRPTLKNVSYDGFAADYQRLEALRDGLKTSGIASLAELSKDYSIVTFEYPLRAPSQKTRKRNVGDTAFLSIDGDLTTETNARSFSIAVPDDSAGRYLVTDYYLPERTLERRYYCSTLDSFEMDGPYESYYRSGNLERTGSYVANRRDGRWKHYHDSAVRTVWYVTDYRHGSMDGRRVAFYPNQKMKRIELWRPYSNATVYEVDGSKIVYVHESDSLINGTCFDPAGAEIPFTAFETFPRPSFDLAQFLSRELRYPHSVREAGISGRVVTKFTVSKDGEVRDAYVLTGAHPDLDQEALRVINALPRWVPGLTDGKPTDVFFTIPITFKVD